MKPDPCGTQNARKRHYRNNEVCKTCDDMKEAAKQARLSPCGTPAARKRHRANNETCAVCEAKFKRPELKPCGTPAAYTRHKKHGEQPCDECTVAYREADANKHRTTGVRARIKTPDLINEIRFLVNAGEGEHRILVATGYVGRGDTLRIRLTQAGHRNLALQVFNNWELAA